jgi:hypothetical protein
MKTIRWGRLSRSGYALIFLAAIAAAILCIKAFGIQTGILRGSPLALEQAIGAVFLLAMLFGGANIKVSQASRRLRLWPLCLILTAIALLYARNIQDPFLSDDYILVQRSSFDFQDVSWSFTQPGGDGSFRPVGALYRDLVGEWAGREPWKWHLAGLLLHVVNCSLLYVVTFLLWSSDAISLLSVFFFGIHGTRPEVVVWSAGNFDSLACFFALAALISMARARLGRRKAPWMVLLSLFLALAILSKESAYATPFLMAGFAWAARDDLRNPAIRWALICSTAVCAILLFYRWELFGGPGGYADPATGEPAILSLSFVGSAKALLLRMWAILLFPVDWDAGSGLSLAIAVGCAAAISLFLASRARSVPLSLRAGLLGATAGSLIPALHLALIGPSELGSRILYLASVPFCVLCAHLVALGERGNKRVLLQAAIVIGMSAALLHNLRAWHRTAIAADQFCADAAAGTVTPAPAAPPREVNGVFFFANGLRECVAMKRSR